MWRPLLEAWMTPKVGDTVIQEVPGPFGTPASISGVVGKGTRGLVVRITGSGNVMGATYRGRKTLPLTNAWHVKGDPERERRIATIYAEEDRVAQRIAAREQAREQETAAAVAKYGALAVSTLKVGNVLVSPSGERMTVQHIVQRGADHEVVGQGDAGEVEGIAYAPTKSMPGWHKIAETPAEGFLGNFSSKETPEDPRRFTRGRWVKAQWSDEAGDYTPLPDGEETKGGAGDDVKGVCPETHLAPEPKDKPFTLDLPHYAEKSLLDTIAGLNKTAGKLRLPLITARSLGTYVNDKKANDLKFRVRYEVNAPRVLAVGGSSWRVVGVVEPSGGGGNLIRTAPGAKFDTTPYRQAAIACAHCNAVRRRNKVVLVADKAGTIKPVGSTCLKEYTGIDPNAVLGVFDYYGELTRAFKDFNDDEWGEGGGGSRAPSAWGIEDVVGLAFGVMRVQGGYAKRTPGYDDALSSGPKPTASLVTMALYDRARDPKGLTKADQDWLAKIAPTAAEKEQAKEVVQAWADSTDNSDFAHNLRELAKAGYIKERMIGIACGGTFGTWLRLSKAKQAPAGAGAGAVAVPENPYLGKAGDKVTFKGTIDRAIPYTTAYGDGRILIGTEQGTGRQWKWFTSSKVEGGEPGPDVFEIKGTIKSTEDNPRFGKATILTRVKIPQAREAAAAREVAAKARAFEVEAGREVGAFEKYLDEADTEAKQVLASLEHLVKAGRTVVDAWMEGRIRSVIYPLVRAAVVAKGFTHPDNPYKDSEAFRTYGGMDKMRKVWSERASKLKASMVAVDPGVGPAWDAAMLAQQKGERLRESMEDWP